jgi:hypothetical protein
MLFDAMEQQTEMAADLMIYRTMFSNYKQRATCKFIGGVAPVGAFTFAKPLAFPGTAGDVKATIAAGLLQLLHRGMASLADKGFMLHAEAAVNGHNLFVPTFAFNGYVCLLSGRSERRVAANA